MTQLHARIDAAAWGTPFAQQIYQVVDEPFLSQSKSHLFNGAMLKTLAPPTFVTGVAPWRTTVVAELNSVTPIRSLSDARGMFQVRWTVHSDDNNALWDAYEENGDQLCAFVSMEVAGFSDGILEVSDLVVTRGSLEILAVLSFARTAIRGVSSVLKLYPTAKEIARDLTEAAKRTGKFLSRPATRAVRAVQTLCLQIAQRLRAFFGGQRLLPGFNY